MLHPLCIVQSQSYARGLTQQQESERHNISSTDSDVMTASSHDLMHSHCIVGSTVTVAYPVNNGHCVVEAEHEEEWPTEGDAGQQNVPDPLSALHLSVVRGRHVATDTGCQGVQHNERCEEAAPVVGVEDPHAGEDKDEDGQGEQLQHEHIVVEQLADCNSRELQLHYRTVAAERPDLKWGRGGRGGGG